MTTQEHLNSFYRFASAALRCNGPDLTVDELFEHWRVQHTTEEDIAAVRESLADFHRGDRGVPFDDHMRELRQKLEQSPDR